MTEWREYKLSKIMETSKKHFKPDKNSQLNYIGLEHIEQGTLRLSGVGVSSSVESNKFFFNKGDVLFGKLRPYFRKVIYAPFDGICSTDIWVCKAKSCCDQKFLFYFLANQDFIDTANTDEGSRMPRASWDYLKDTLWILPPLPEQKAIAEVLSSLDDKIDLLTRQNNTLEDFAQTYFRKWFVEDASEEWEVARLGDILESIESGSRPKGGIDPELVNGVPSIGAESINGLGVYDFSKTKYVTRDFFNNMRRGVVKSHDVLVYKDGAYVGRKGMFGNDFPFAEFAVNEHVFILRSNEKAGQIFLYFLLQEEELAQLNSNSAQPGLNQQAMKAYEIVLPPKKLINDFETFAEPLIDKIFENAKQMRTLRKLRDTLLPKLISGEVRVKQ